MSQCCAKAYPIATAVSASLEGVSRMPRVGRKPSEPALKVFEGADSPCMV
jgi:hypothetical protein